jgi:hypothetical protein
MLLGVIGNAVLVFLPGAWLTFGIPSRGVPFWAKLLTGVMLAPFAVGLQFYACRLLGLTFEATAVLLVFLNLPVLYLIWRARGAVPRFDRRMILTGLIVCATILICIAPFLLNAQKRLYTWEAWTQADVVYSIANGELLPQDAELAGVSLSYPWTGHIYQGILSYLMQSPPASNYIWSNLVWLVCIFAFAGAIVAALGGGSIARAMVAVWLCFGVNFVGYIMGQVVPASFMRAHPILGNIWGDNRYTPWLDKIVFFGQMYFAMGLFVAVLYFMIKRWPEGLTLYHYIVTFLLLTALGVIYVILLPPACAVVAARGFTQLFERSTVWRRRIRAVGGLACAGLIALALSYVVFKVTTQDRTGEATLAFNGSDFMIHRAAESLMVTSPLLIGLLFVLRGLWKTRLAALVILGAGAVAGFALYTALDIPWYRNEYKYIFTSAICLAPFPGLALDPVMRRLGRLAVPVLTLITLVLAAPFAYHVYTQADTMAYTEPGPPMDLSAFDLRLDSPTALAQAYDVIRRQTPVATMLLLDKADLHVPTLTQRQLYVPPVQQNPYPGVLVTSDETLTEAKGYDKSILETRRATLTQLFDGNNGAERSSALARVLAFRRPVALLLDTQRDAALLAWLQATHEGQSLYSAGKVDVWMISADQTSAAALSR